ncbi:hypothetical protein ACRRTK_009719 [Alexandromys fortis]
MPSELFAKAPEKLEKGLKERYASIPQETKQRWRQGQRPTLEHWTELPRSS